MHLPRPTRWRAFASAHYRPFQAIAIGQAFTASYASDALFVPLLLRLGAPPALVVVVGAAPVGGAALQAFAPHDEESMTRLASEVKPILERA